MKIFLEFLPWLCFAVTFWLTKEIYWATVVLIPVVMLQSGIQYKMNGQLEQMQLITLILVVVFGGLTLILHDNRFIQWKPTFVNTLFALVFLGSHFIGKKPIIERLLDNKINLQKQHWRNLSLMWGGFFVFSAFINGYVVLNYSESTWVNFKLFGQLLITLGFVTLQTIYLFYCLNKNRET